MCTARCNGRFSCHACHHPPPRMPPCHAHPSCHTCPPAMHAPCHAHPPAMHAPLPCMPPVIHALLPCMPPYHTCPPPCMPPTTHSPTTHAPLPRTPLPEQNHRRLWKHNLAATSLWAVNIGSIWWFDSNCRIKKSQFQWAVVQQDVSWLIACQLIRRLKSL